MNKGNISIFELLKLENDNLLEYDKLFKSSKLKFLYS